MTPLPKRAENTADLFSKLTVSRNSEFLKVGAEKLMAGAAMATVEFKEGGD